ncbi:MAG TPA: PQQ-binding-like beta-propeller repeat protein [Terriglobia bacterium]|nr:PQQ-binding-like beta-propeller repeat protein [Terriglobia bacterium]
MKATLRGLFVLQIFVASLSSSISLLAADWPMYSHDPQRTGWASEEKTITRQKVRGLELKWKVKVKNDPKFLTALTAPVIASDVDTEEGKKSLVYVAGSSNNIYALDAATGAVVWDRTFDSQVLPGKGQYQGTVYCPLGINATPMIERATGTIYVIAMDGRLFGMDLATGKDKFQPMPFVAPFSKNWSLNLVDGIVYTALSQGCGNAPSGFYSMDIRSPRRPLVRHLLFSTTETAGIWGRGGPVAGKNHRIYGLTADGKLNPSKGDLGSSAVAASLPDLELVDYFTPPNWQDLNKHDLDLASASPVWFSYGGYELLAGGGKGGVVYLMDANSLGGKGHDSALFTTPPLGNDEAGWNMRGIWGAPAEWKDETGEAWVYIPMWGPVSKKAPTFPRTNGPNPHGSIMAFNVGLDGTSKKPILKPAWVSSDFNPPDPPIVANGVVFALSTGENPDQTSDRSSFGGRDLKNTRPGVLYALDAKTGEVLYESGGLINSWVHFSGIAVADGQVYTVDHDSWVYCFGLKKQ